jgi:leader peptidase (prepilin peptidase)/N-methyltransferase
MIGSVLSMVVYRLPKMMDQHDHIPTKHPVFNLFLPRSHCPHCKKTIPAWHNIPLCAYIFLWGHCAYCHNVISWRYPTIEALTLSLSLLALYCFGYHLTLLTALPFIWILICLAFIDLEHQLLPDVLTLSLLWLGLLINTNALFCPLSTAVWSAAGAYVSLWSVIKIYYLLTGKLGMGHGDFKLFAAFGAWFGWTSLTTILLIACIMGTVIGLLYLGITKQNRNTPIPFGPYLCIAGLAYLFLPMLK